MSHSKDSQSIHGPSKKNWFSFTSLMVMQVQNSFNDKAVQFLLVALGAALLKLAGSGDGSVVGSMEYVLAGLIVSPFILLAPVAGWVGDRFSKTKVIRFSSWLQLAILILLFVAVSLKSIRLAVFAFFLLAVQSTFLSPSKMGVIKELVGSKKLGFASGLLEMGTILAILAGSILVNFWYDARLVSGMTAWQAVTLPVFVVMCLGPISVLASYGIEVVPAASKERFQASILVRHFRQLGVVMKNRALKLSAFGVAFFWTFGGFIQLVSVQIAKEVNTIHLAGEGRSLAWMMLAAGFGIAFGSLVSSLISKRGIELGLVPVGGAVMVLGTAAMGLCDLETVWFHVSMMIAGAGAAMFLVPLNATLQDACDPAERGSVLAGSNLLNCCGGLLAVAFQLLLKNMGVSVSSQFFLFAGLSVVATGFATKILPQHAVRFVVLAIFRLVYRIKIENVGRLPAKGGVLMVANHVSYIDAFVLSAASPRPIRFLMDEKFMKRGGIVSLFTKLFNTVPISPTRAKEAIQVAANAVEEGAVVCIFPEGQLTRSGCMNEMKKGFQMIARRAKAPVIPVYMDGIWGSVSSFERRQYFGKRPYSLQYGVTVVFGDVLESRQASSEKVRHILNLLGEEAFIHREVLKRPKRVLSRKLKTLDGWHESIQNTHAKLAELSELDQRRIVSNALQLADGYSFQRGMSVVLDAGVNEAERNVIVCLALLLKFKCMIASPDTDMEQLQRWEQHYGKLTYLGGEGLRGVFEQAEVEGDYYHFGEAVRNDSSRNVYAITMAADVAFARSSPHPDSDNPHQQFQPGWKEDSVGRLLPCFGVQELSEGVLALSCRGVGLHCEIEGSIDEEGFVFLSPAGQE